ncbi:MAG TPA: hypothetical protein VG742_10220, partial [Dongiaceae bacterium]|nr:hypothetical protein [Dongiaceae bacterium]
MLINEVAVRVADFSAEEIDALAAETARLAILDTIGCTLAGSRTDVTRTVLKTLRAARGGELGGRASLF